jgi:DNA-binding IclR family transcriptional regulator
MKRDKYLIKAVVHSAQVLSVFNASGEALPLGTIAARCGLQRSTTFRMLYTLEHCGFIEKIARNLYRLRARQIRWKRPVTALADIAS